MERTTKSSVVVPQKLRSPLRSLRSAHCHLLPEQVLPQEQPQPEPVHFLLFLALNKLRNIF